MEWPGYSIFRRRTVLPCTAGMTPAKYRACCYSPKLTYYTTPRSVTSLQTDSRRSPNYTARHQAKLDMPKFLLPNVTVVTAYELQQLQSNNLGRCTEIRQHTHTVVYASTDIRYGLVVARSSHFPSSRKSNWFATILSTTGAVVIIRVLCLTVYLRFCNMPCALFKPNAKTEATALPLDTIEPGNAEAEPRLVFATYAKQSTG
jgi:hypothetical protein